MIKIDSVSSTATVLENAYVTDSWHPAAGSRWSGPIVLIVPCWVAIPCCVVVVVVVVSFHALVVGE